ncbi:molybdenum cofactor guanylyltransferase [Sphingomonas solaris]|uniref:Molybdenum cofactor guanylyltransferase n=1 Tax=Alterirhizorhabdus solaris TaxID=2529389 RepID=A0A558QUT5_9SPHN|nr:molybdenum cofactor guanylyltransferase [Sphingomonas solaris]TVV70910.1 molybdenum cofactor guanylyltransferase [Sphingomonas solaris]
MTILGAIFAGGAARRFGGDKAAAPIGGRAMIEHVAARLAPQCDALVIVGREWPGLTTVADRPRPGLGPLGALAGALTHARATGHDLVLTSGCDLPDLPLDLAARLAPAPAVVRGQPLLGLWHAADADRLAAWLEGDNDRAMRSWIAAIDARRVSLERDPANINTQSELAAYLAREG